MEERQSWPAQTPTGTPANPSAGKPASRPAERKKARRKQGGGCLTTVLAVAVAFMILVLLAMGGLAYLYFSDLNLPGLSSLGVDLGAKSVADATASLQQEWQQRSVIVSEGATTWTLPPERLGIFLDVDATVKQAHDQGRAPSTLQNVLQTRGHIVIQPVWSFDRGTAEALMNVLAGQLQVPPQNAGVRVVDGHVEAVPAIQGRQLDVQATLDYLEAHPWETLAEGHLRLVMVPLKPGITDVSSAIDSANQLLSAPVPLRLYDPMTDEKLTWAITPTVVGSWLQPHSDPANPAGVEWTVDPAKARAFLEKAQPAGPDRYVDAETAAPEVVKSVSSGHQEVRLRLYHRDRKHVVQAGETLSSIAVDFGMPYPWIQKANPGSGDSLRAGQAITIPTVDKLMPLTPVENKRIVVSLSKQRMVAYENGAVKWDWQASTGMPSSPTSPGVFQIQSHDPNAFAANWNLWMPNFMGIYRPVPDQAFMNGFHGFPSRGGSQILWTGDLGRRVTYGCILISTDNSKKLYDWAEEGVVVAITP